MNQLILWRVELPATADSRPDQLVLGLSRHLTVAGLIGVTTQIGDSQQAYVALEGCAGCALGRCLPGCLGVAMLRTLRATYGLDADLALVRSGLSLRPHTRAFRLRPTRSAVPIAAAALTPWPEARLDLTWSPALMGKGTVLSGVLYVGAEGPDPAAEQIAAGWQAEPVRRALPAPATPSQPLLNRGRVFTGTPFLALPPVAAPAAEVAL